MPPLEPFAQNVFDMDGDEFINGDKKGIIDPSIPTKETVPSILEIKKSIPKEYFIPSLSSSLKYVAFDLMIVTLTFAAYLWLDTLPLIPQFVKAFVILPVYGFFQGTMFWAIFVLGHDCGHGSFSRHPWINDTVGTLLHGLICVPYTPWKLSHRHHHKNTGNIDKDEVFYPIRESERRKMYGDSKLTSKVAPYFALGIGWIFYLIDGYGSRATSHINPFHPLFRNHRIGAWTSVLCVTAQLGLLYYASTIYGILTVARYYFLPLIVFGSWLVITTFLHHHGVEENLTLPWFSDENWSYVLGNLSSVDRDYGIFHKLTHDIGTHQIHHLFPSIPHYYLKNATSAFQKRYPQFVRESKEPIMQTFMNTFEVFSDQYIISDNVEVFVYQDNTKQRKKI